MPRSLPPRRSRLSPALPLSRSPFSRHLAAEPLEARCLLSANYEFAVVAQTGPQIQSLGGGPSINDLGLVAFKATENNDSGEPADNLYVFDPAANATTTLMNRVFMYNNVGAEQLTPGTQMLSPNVQINNLNDVLAWRRLNAQVQVGFPFGQILVAPLTYLETWNPASPGLPQSNPAMGLPAGASAGLWFFLNPATGAIYPSPLNLTSPYEAVYAPMSLDNAGRISMSAIVTGEGNNRVSTDGSGSLVGRGGIGDVSITPVLANNNHYVFTTSDGRIYAEQWDLAAGLQLIAGPASGFTAVSTAGISDDGQVIAFVGTNADGTGLFVCNYSSATNDFTAPTRISGIAFDNYLDPNEAFRDFDGDGMFDPGTETDSGYFSSLKTNARVSVNTLPGEGYQIAFFATDNQGGDGFYTVVWDAVSYLSTQVMPAPILVVGVGERLPGLPGSVSGISTYDPLNASGDIVFHVTLGSGAEAIVTARHDDLDGDGLYDHWEERGIDADGDGTPDLILPGADKAKKDLYVEIDSMTGFAPDRSSLSRVVAAFAAAPNAPIVLHLEFGEENLPRAELDFSWGVFELLKSIHFGTPSQQSQPTVLSAKSLAYRYCLFADRLIGSGSSGISEIGGNDFAVTLGTSLTPGGTLDQQAGTFMHELGHTLGLFHTGGQGVVAGRSKQDAELNYKPNYRSVMNYAFQFPYTSFDGWALDYSRQALPGIDEHSIDETTYATDLGATPGTRLLVGTTITGYVVVVQPDGKVDLNRDGQIGVLANFDVNGSGTIKVLEGAEDWSRLQFNFRTSPYALNGVSPEFEPHFTSEDYIASLINLDGGVNSPPLASP